MPRSAKVLVAKLVGGPFDGKTLRFQISGADAFLPMLAFKPVGDEGDTERTYIWTRWTDNGAIYEFVYGTDFAVSVPWKREESDD